MCVRCICGSTGNSRRSACVEVRGQLLRVTSLLPGVRGHFCVLSTFPCWGILLAPLLLERIGVNLEELLCGWVCNSVQFPDTTADYLAASSQQQHESWSYAWFQLAARIVDTNSAASGSTHRWHQHGLLCMPGFIPRILRMELRSLFSRQPLYQLSHLSSLSFGRAIKRQNQELNLFFLCCIGF